MTSLLFRFWRYFPSIYQRKQQTTSAMVSSENVLTLSKFVLHFILLIMLLGVFFFLVANVGDARLVALSNERTAVQRETNHICSKQFSNFSVFKAKTSEFLEFAYKLYTFCGLNTVCSWFKHCLSIGDNHTIFETMTWSCRRMTYETTSLVWYVLECEHTFILALN